MKLMPALWKRSRLGLFRAVAVVGALAAMAGGLATVSAAPARADQTVTSGGPFTVTYPGGDMVATYDAAGVDPVGASNFLSTLWPKGVGLSAGASLSALAQATWQANAGIVGSFFPDPPAFSGGSATVASDGAGGSVITVDIPAADVQANELQSWLRGALSQAAGIAASIVAFGTCEAAALAAGAGALVTTGPAGGLVLTAVGSAICSGLGAASWTLVATIVGQALSGGPLNADFWWGALSATLTAFVGGALASPILTPIFRQAVSSTLAALSKALTGITKFLSYWTGGAFNSVTASIKNFFARVARLFRTRMPALDIELGTVSPAVSGEFELLPVPDLGEPFVVPLCMDAYGATGGSASPGQAVAINSCNGSTNQGFDYYPDGMISVYGLCVAPDGGTSSIGTPLLSLEQCDGAADQEWSQSGQALVNKGGGGCLDDPNLDTTPGTQLDLDSCNGSAAQNWLSPAAKSCDIYAGYGTACVAAYSMTRALYAAYDGPLYQVKRASDSTTADIGLLAAGGDVNASAQDSFCAGTTCTVTEIYDQSPAGNNLTIEGAGGAGPADHGAVANALPVKVNGSEAYGLDVEPGVGYRADATLGVATNGEPEGMYMVASGTHVNSGCCFDFGNAEANNDDTGQGHMDAVNLTTWCGSNSAPCTGSGPWVQADLENGQWLGNGSNPANKGNSTPFVTAMLGNNGQSTFALAGGDSTSGGLSQWYNGALPSGYTPMKQEGAIVLGTGGDNSQTGVGSWFEGVMTAGEPSAAANSAVQANIVAAKYSGSTNPSGSDSGTAPSAAGQAVVHAAGATGVAASGYSSVYTVDSANQHLQETYLPYMGDSWTTQDLSATGGTLPGTPPVMPGTQPVALVHCGFTSVFTVDAASGDLQETYLQAIGDAWLTQDLSAEYHTPPTNVTPTAVLHSAGAPGGTAACGYASVYTRDRNGDLQETYLPNAGFPGDSWITQDLSGTGGTLAGTPSILAGTSPVAIVHCGFTSVYTVDGNHHLQETYLPAIGGSWSTQDLSGTGGTLPGTPHTTTTPTAVVHTAGAAGASPGCGYTSVYTVDEGSQDLQETYLPDAGFPGDSWQTQDLSAKYHTPAVAPGTAPVALVHLGYTSVYTVDQASDQVQETYLAAIGGGWLTQSLSANYQTPTTNQTPIVLLHPDAGGTLDWVSVFTVGQFNAHLQETYLSNVGFPGDSWVTQDLSSTGGSLPGTPPAYIPQSSQASWSVDHDGYTSVYTGNTSNHLEETYLSAMGKSWVTQDLSGTGGTLPGAPDIMNNTVPVAVAHDGYTSVYTIDAGDGSHTKGDLQETYLKAIGGSWATQDLSQEVHTPASKVTPTAVFHDGYVSVYTVDASNGNLWETYLPSAGFPGDSWQAQNLSGTGGTLPGTPAVDAETSPVAIVHDGYVSVYTVDATDAADGSTLGDLQETYLPFMGGSWSTQNLSVNYHVPLVNILTSPTAVFHDGYTSVYTVDAASTTNPELPGDLQESYLPAMGDAWSTQDLSTSYQHTPQVLYGVQPMALYHTGYTSVYTVDGGNNGTKIGDLQETYLPAMSDAWSTQDMSVKYPAIGTVGPFPSPSALVHYDTSGGLTWTSTFTINDANGDVQENYLPVIGDAWSSQDLSKLAHTPPV